VRLGHYEEHLVVSITVQNFGRNRYSFDNMLAIREFGLKMPIHAPKLFWGRGHLTP